MTKGPDRKVTLQDVWDCMRFGMPETTSTLAEELPCSKDTVYSRLEELEDKEYIGGKKVSSRSKVFWKPTHNPEIVPDKLQPNTHSEKDPEIIRTLAEAKRTGEPLVSKEIAEETDDTQDNVYDRLNKLEELGWVNSLKTGATGKVWWLSEVESNRKREQTSLSISPVLKNELKRVRDTYDEPQKLEEALIFAMKYPDVTNHQLEGDEKGISPIKVSKSTLEHIGYLQDNNHYTNNEEVIRDHADIAYREVNTRSVTRTPPE
jgi:DNA-binding MarR family transcriptional regulator